MREQASKYLIRKQSLVLVAIPLFWAVLMTVFPHPIEYWTTYWWMLPIAFIIALTVNTVGISGAALFVPFFTLIFPFLAHPLTPLESVKLGLITESFGLSSSAMAFYWYGLVDGKLAARSILGAIPWVIAGALFSNWVPESVLLTIVAASLIISIYMLRHEKKLKTMRLKEDQKPHVDTSTPGGHQITRLTADGTKYTYCLTKKGYRKRFWGFGAGGFFQGSAGFGIGEMGVISMIITRIPIKIAIGTSHFIVASTAILATIIHLIQSAALHTPTPWNIPFMTVPAVIMGGQIAPYVAARLPKKSIEKAISILFFIIAIALILLAWRPGLFQN